MSGSAYAGADTPIAAAMAATAITPNLEAFMRGILPFLMLRPTVVLALIVTESSSPVTGIDPRSTNRFLSVAYSD